MRFIGKSKRPNSKIAGFDVRYVVRVTRKNTVLDTLVGDKNQAVLFAFEMRNLSGPRQSDDVEIIEMTDAEYAAYVAASQPESQP